MLWTALGGAVPVGWVNAKAVRQVSVIGGQRLWVCHSQWSHHVDWFSGTATEAAKIKEHIEITSARACGP